MGTWQTGPVHWCRSHLSADSLPQADPVDKDQGPQWEGALEHNLQ